jgi:hypothetical protein
MATATALTRHDIEAMIVKRCWEDDAFRKEFSADPVGAAAKYLEVPAASLPHIVVHEEPPGSWYIVLPEKPASGGELSEADLETIAGGTMVEPARSVQVGSVLATIIRPPAFRRDP